MTTFQVKNMSPKAIARLTIEEFWYDKTGNPVSGDKKFLKKPLLPGEVGTIVLETPKQPNMDRNSYKFSHGNGDMQAEGRPRSSRGGRGLGRSRHIRLGKKGGRGRPVRGPLRFAFSARRILDSYRDHA